MKRVTGGFMTRLMMVVGVAIIIGAVLFMFILPFMRRGEQQVATVSSGEAGGIQRQVGDQSITVAGDSADKLILLREVAPTPLPPTPIPPTEPAIEAQQLQPSPEPAPTQTPVVPTPAPVQQTGSGTFSFTSHTVQQGDTLYGLARRYNTSITAMAEHKISSASLVPGAVLQIPVANLASCPSGRAHVVEEGENVFRLAIKYNTTKEQIRAINNLNANYLIKAGGVLCLP
jgi:LysM repeat protein